MNNKSGQLYRKVGSINLIIKSNEIWYDILIDNERGTCAVHDTDHFVCTCYTKPNKPMRNQCFAGIMKDWEK